MANFGFSRLRVVAPYEPHWREAKSAVGAADLLENAKSVESFAEAVADCTLVAGTGTREYRRPGQRVVSLLELTPLIDDAMGRNSRVALVFGSEKHGLTRDDLSLCHVLVEIPTDARQPSMNLGQAVAVCLYELIRAERPICGDAKTPRDAGTQASKPAAAVSGELDRLAQVIEETMTASGYSPAIMSRANRLDVRELLRRLGLTQADARRAMGLFRRVLWRLRNR